MGELPAKGASHPLPLVFLPNILRGETMSEDYKHQIEMQYLTKDELDLISKLRST